ncbi:hypothetical protein ACLOJK_030386 [Asimina triloba]
MQMGFWSRWVFDSRSGADDEDGICRIWLLAVGCRQAASRGQRRREASRRATGAEDGRKMQPRFCRTGAAKKKSGRTEKTRQGVPGATTLFVEATIPARAQRTETDGSARAQMITG